MYQVTRYFVNHYSEDNYTRWKNIGLGILSAYMILILWLFDITSQLLIIYIIQTLIISFIIETIETKSYQQWWKKLNSCWKTKAFENFVLVNNDTFDKDYIMIN